MAIEKLTFEQIVEKEPIASNKVEALRSAIADAEKLGDNRLVDSLRAQFSNACDDHVAIFVQAIDLPFEQYREVIKSMESRRAAA